MLLLIINCTENTVSSLQFNSVRSDNREHSISSTHKVFLSLMCHHLVEQNSFVRQFTNCYYKIHLTYLSSNFIFVSLRAFRLRAGSLNASLFTSALSNVTSTEYLYREKNKCQNYAGCYGLPYSMRTRVQSW